MSLKTYVPLSISTDCGLILNSCKVIVDTMTKITVDFFQTLERKFTRIRFSTRGDFIPFHTTVRYNLATTSRMVSWQLVYVHSVIALKV